MKNESFRRSFSMLCAAVGLIVLMGIAVAGQMESTEQQNQKLLSENQKLTEENERLEKDLNNWKIAKEIKEAPAVRLKEDSENWMLALVNEEYPLAKDYTPASLTKLDEKCSVDTRIYGELEQMIADARLGQPLRVVRGKEEIVLRSGTEPYIVTKEELRETIDYISHYSLYAYENELRQGFVTVEGGHRVGVAGKVIMEKERVKNIQYISSLNIRVSHEVLGCADRLIPYIVANKQVCHTLIISPPCCGKTTLIRDLIRQISDGNEYVKGCSVGVVDERSELGGCYLGIAQNHLGTRTDVLDCCPKAEGMIMLIRSMSPQVIAVDEIGTVEDIHAIEYAMQCGCRMIASVHGLNMDEASNKPVLGDLIRRRMFQRYVVLGNEKGPGEILGIYDERGSVLCRNL